jgi:predicted Kef-type K+ transport protein/voltage-gated potassium channel Kch
VIEVVCISFAFAFGLAVRRIGLPPMVGFLAAGFAIAAVGPEIGLPDETRPVLDHVAHLGVLLLLFAVGLKLRLGQIAQPQVLGGALLHAGFATAALSIGLALLAGVDWQTAVLLGVALSFSSTVFSAKTLEAKRDIGAFYGRTAIGILIVQDIIALAVLAFWGGQSPTPWALAVILALPLLRPVLFRLLDLTGHDEMLVLAGLLLALVLGGAGFAAVGLSSEIGALVMGLILSTHKQAKELSNALWGLKELFLVGFFLQIGLSGLPGWGSFAFALVLALLLPLKGALFFVLLVRFGLRARTAFLSAVNLTSYSEFALIVAATLLPDWLVPLALAVSFSFLVAAPLDRLAPRLFDRLEPVLRRFEVQIVHQDEPPADLGGAQVLILGMGRTGTAAYDHLAETAGTVVGLDADSYRVAHHAKAGRNVLLADVEDSGFWRALRLGPLSGVILAMDNVEAKEFAARALRQHGFDGPIVSHALYDDHLPRLHAAGATHTYLTMTQAGIGLAEQAARAIGLAGSPPSPDPPPDRPA